MHRSHRTHALVAAAALAAAGCSGTGTPAPNPNPTLRLSAASVRTAAGADLGAVADRDTTTGVAVEGALDAVVRFDHPVELRRIKAHGAAISVEVAGHAAASPEGAWAAAALDGPATASEVTVRVVALGAGARLDELELWGAGRPRAPRDVQRMAEATRTAPAAFEDVRVIAADPAAATLDPAGARESGRCLRARFQGADATAARRAYLVYEADVPRAFALERSVDGDAMEGGFWVGNVAAPRTLVDELDPERLGAVGEVTLCVPAAATGKVQLSGVRLLVATDDGLDVFDRDTHLRLASAVDADPRPSAVTGSLELGFDRPVALDAAAVRLGSAPARLSALELLEAGGWSRQADVELSSETSALPVAGRVARALRLAFPASARAELPSASVAEVTAEGSGVGGRIGAARIVLTAPALRFEGGRDVGERFGDRAYLAGWAESPAGAGRVEIGGAEVGVAGAFALALDRPASLAGPWTVEIKARFPDGVEIARTVVLDRDAAAELLQAAAPLSLSDDARYGRENRTAWGAVGEDGGSVRLGTDVTFDAPPGALATGTSVGITRKGPEEIPPLDAGMVNVTAPAHSAYRFLPKGQRFLKPVRVGIPYDPSLLPDGIGPEEIQTWFYDDVAERWTALPRAELQRATARVVSETTHFTFMINAVLVLPDHPGPTSFNPNSIKDVKAADPSTGIDVIAPPAQSEQGTAQVGLPIRLPAARGAYQPELRIAYDSAGGNGWLGVGWDLAPSSVQIDTRFGVPQYEGVELRYLLDGEQLVPTEEKLPCEGGGDGTRYRARVERSFRRVVRCGGRPEDQWFEVRDKQGNFYLYGKSPLARLAAYSGPAYVGQWFLERVVDTNGNLTQYAYDTDTKALPTVPHVGEPAVAHGEDFRAVYLRSIQYSGRVPGGEGAARDALGTAESGPYHVELVSEMDSRGRHLARPDAITSGRLGFKTVVRRRLASVLVQLDRNGTTETIREYRLSYERSRFSFGKSRLAKVEVLGAGPAASRKVFHTHAFQYWEPNLSEPFAAPVAWTFTESPDDQAISHTEENGFGTHGYGGIGWTYDKITGTVGFRAGTNQHWSRTRSVLMDVNGDGLPDRITEGGDGYDVRFNTGTLFPGVTQRLRRALPPGDPAAGETHPVPLPTLGKEEGKGWNVAGQASFAAFSVNAGYSHFQTKTSELLTDADGDGLVDVVRPSGVLLNQLRSPSRKGFAFAPQVTGTSLASTPASSDDDQQRLDASIQEQLKPSDVVLEWVAPFAGRVDVSGALSFVDRPRPTPAPPERDGVRLQVFLWNGDNGTSAQKKLELVKTLAEVSVPTPVGLAELEVLSGWRVYFVLSTLADFPVDRLGPSPLEDVRFSPSISYTTLGICSWGDCRALTEEEQARVEPNGAATFHFEQAGDFRVAGQPTPSVAIPATGTLRLDTSLVKRRSTDDVRVCVQRFGQKAEVKDLRCEATGGGFDNLVDQTFPADEAGTFPLAGSWAVVAGEKLVFRVQTDLPVDPAAADWSIAGGMETVCTSDGTGCDAPPPEMVEAMQFVADAWFPLHNPVHPWVSPSSSYSVPDYRPLVPWVAPYAGTLKVVMNPADGFRLGYRQSNAIFAAVRTADSLVVKKSIFELYAPPYAPIVREIHVAQGERVYFELYSDAWFYAEWAPHVTLRPDFFPIDLPQAITAHPRFDLTWSDDRKAAASVRSRFGGGHHLWYFGAWHGENDEPFDPKRLAKSPAATTDEGLYDEFQSDTELQDATKLASPLVPRRLGTWLSKSKPGLAARVPAFVSKDGGTFVAAGVMHASREGEFVQAGAGEAESTSLPAMFALGSALRQSSGESWSLSGGVSVGSVGASLSVSTGNSVQKSDVFDMNGDRVIDVLAGDGGGTSIRYTDVRDPGQPAREVRDGNVRLRRSEDASASFGVGISDPWRRLSDDGIVKALLAMFPSTGGGIGVNFSSTERELADVNGDGLPDEVKREGGCFSVRLNLGTRFAAQPDCVPVGDWSVARLDDLVGSLADVLPSSVVTPNRVRRTTSISLNANAGFTLYENYGATVNWDSSIAATAVVLSDVNGDGLPDYVRKSTKDGVFYVRMNRGWSFGEEQQLPVHAWPSGVTKPWLQDTGLAAGVNGILRLVNGETPSVDSVEAQGTYGEMPTIGFVYSWGVGPLSPFFTPWLHFSVGGDATFRRVSGFALGLQDMDGDGFADHVLKAEDAPRTDNSAVWVRLNQMGKSNLLRRVERPLGGSFDLDYARTGNTVEMPESRWVLSQVVVHDGRSDGTPGHDVATTFTYADGRYDRHERVFLGFGTTTEARADGSSVARRFWNDSALVKGLLLTETLSDAAGRAFLKTTNEYPDPILKLADGAKACRDATPFFLRPSTEDWCGSFFVPLDAIQKEIREGGEDVIVTRQRFEYDDENGNITAFTDLGDADPANAGDDLHASVAYATDAAATAFYSVARPEELVIRNHAGDGTFLRKRWGHYDSRGNLDQLRSYLDDVKYVQAELVWNADGRLSELQQPEVDGRRYWIRYHYDDSGVTRTYPTRVEDAHGYVSRAEYDERFGEAARTVDLNGNATRREFDAFGRVVRLYSPYDGAVPAVRVEYAHAAAVPRARTRNLLPGGGTLDTVVFMDGVLRVIQTQKTAEVYGRGPGVAVSGRQRFDVMGRVAEQGITHFVANLDPGLVDVEPAYKTAFEYDLLGRKVRTVEPNGGVFRMSYDLARPANDPFLRRRATIADPLDKRRALYRRVDERLAAVEEHVGTEANTTRYRYDPMGELEAVVDAKGNETHVEHDRLGRRTQLRSLDTGTTDFAYDDMGNLVSRQTANLRKEKQFVTYEYDLDQLIAVHYPLGADTKYEYGPPGAPENGAARIVRVLDDAGFETRGYGRLGEVVRSTRTVKPLKPNDSPQTFETRFSYDAFGRMLSITYPDGERLAYGYDAAGLVKSAIGDRPATKHYEAATETYLETMAYDEHGQRRFARLGNGVATTWSYEPDTQRLHHVDTAANGRILQELTYVYDLVGNVKTMTNALGEATGRRSGAVSYTFGYDDLYRLTTAEATAKARPGVVDSFKATYEFDEIHNLERLDQEHWLTTATDLGTETAYPPHTNHHFGYEYGSAGPHQPTRIGDRNIVYDLNGNTLRECRDHGDPKCETNADHLRRYFWGEDNELLAVIDGGGWNVTRFIYDADGNRVVKLGRGGESITIGQFFALKGRRAATKHVFVGETRIASKLLPPPGWETEWSEGTAPSGPIVVSAVVGGSANDVSGCDPSAYQPQKCPIDPAANPVLDRRLTDTKVRPETYYYHSDQVGSTTWVTDQNGRVHEHVEYFPYGEVWRDPRSDSDGAPVHRQQFLFTSKELDEETGLYYFGARYLDPVRARWASPDPALLSYLPTGPDENLPGLGGVYQPVNLSLYAYAFFNPLRLRDADGKETVGELIQRKGVEAAGRGSNVATFGWAFAEAAWTFFGAEHVSRITDAAISSNKEITGGDVFWGTVEVATLGKGGGAVAGARAIAPKAGRVLGRLAERVSKVFRAAEEGNYVYRSVNAAGKVQYVGITNDFARRAAEHLTSKGIAIEKVLTNLSRSDARAVEQALIEIHGLAKNGGTLMNKINSIAKSNPVYAEALERGYELLKKAGYK